jgi:exonuclease SbcC
MRIERVTAHAFGPFRGRTLELAPGLTIVIGANEAGKTSWHAAIRAAVCGLRRGRGRATAIDAAFEERHRPWDDRERWEVEARLRLDDGRTIEIHQDLAGKVACRATDVVLGRDVSDEIMSGTPDASRWLGLDRDAFAATVCVDQAEILSIAQDGTAAALQEHMQRAASTRGTDATAAQARARITAYRRDHVGVDRVGARGPLRAAKERVALAEAELAEARRRHEEYLAAGAEVEAATRAAQVGDERLGMAEAALAAASARKAADRLARAEELSARHRSAPASLATTEAQAATVASALDRWSGRPRPAPLDGESAAELERALAALPAVPIGDAEPHPTVVGAARRLEVAREAERAERAAHDAGAMPMRSAPAGRSGLIAPTLAVAALLGAALLGLSEQLAAAGTVALLGLILAGWAWRHRAAGQALHREARLAQAREEARHQRLDELARAVDQARAGLGDALATRAAAASSVPEEDLAAYEAACAQRAAQAARAARRGDLERAVAARRAAEGAHAERAAAAAHAESALREAADKIGLAEPGLAPDVIVTRLEEWRAARSADLRRREEALAEWHELRRLLDGGSIDELRRLAAEQRGRADELAAALGGVDLEGLIGRADLEVLARAEREERDEARQRADTLNGALDQMRREIPDVAEAEERVAEARAELSRVEDLGRVLDETLRLVKAAEERVHRDLAPILAEGIRHRLGDVTLGAYVDASVDPADLAVQVKEAGSGRWRPALLLSQGTREQVYLLLRAAMAQSLVTTGETAPLLLDEVTAQADPRRTEGLLEALAAISRERQVVLFTHDERVAAWAERRLDEPRDRLVRLGRPHEAEPAASTGAIASA